MARNRTRLRRKNKGKFEEAVQSTYEVGNEDFREHLAVDESLMLFLSLLNITGQAKAGHSAFNGSRYEQATFRDVIEAIPSLTVEGIESEVRDNVGSFRELVEGALIGELDGRRLEELYSTITGVQLPLNGGIERESFLRGIVFSGFWDTTNYRVAARKQANGRKVKIGAGDEYFVNMKRLGKAGLSGKDLANKVYGDEQIASLKRRRIIVNENTVGAKLVYICRQAGPGVSDRLAMIRAGMIHVERYGEMEAESVMRGALVGDLLDTLKDLAGERRHYDTELANRIQNYWRRENGQLLLQREQVGNLILYAAKGNIPKVGKDCGFAELMRVKGRGTMFEADMKFAINSGNGEDNNIPEDPLYQVARKRLTALARN